MNAAPGQDRLPPAASPRVLEGGPMKPLTVTFRRREKAK